jgi:hypothetical protein
MMASLAEALAAVAHASCPAPEERVSLRRSQIEEYCSWSVDPLRDQRPWRSLSVAGGVEIGFYKPGKDWKKYPHDMTPTLRSGGRDLLYRPSFENLFASLRALSETERGLESLEMIGTLMVRSARFDDHEAGPRGVQYALNPEVVRALRDRTPLIGALDPVVFLTMCEAIAINDDVRYQTWRVGSGHEPGSLKPKLTSAGRPNTLLTLAHVISALLGRSTWSSLLGDFTQQPVGVAPLGAQESLEAFPGAEDSGRRAEVAKLGPLLADVREVLERRLGEPIDSLIASCRDSVNAANKSAHAAALRCLLAAELKDRADELAFDLRGSGLVYVKTVRLERNLLPAEGIPLNSVSRDVQESVDWSSSRLLRVVSRPWVAVVFACDNEGVQRLAAVRVIRFQARDIRDCHRVWERAKALSTSGDTVFAELALGARAPGASFYVNTKGRVGTSDGGRPTTPRSFWLASRRMAELMWSSSSG